MFNEKFTLANMCGRPVFLRKLTTLDITGDLRLKLCADCGRRATTIVFELFSAPLSSKWAWCGKDCSGG